MKVNYHPAMFDAGKQLEEIMATIVYKDVPGALRSAQAQGFPKDEKDYTLYLKNRGRESKRKLSTIRPQYLKIGTKGNPLTFRFMAHSSIEDVLEAVRAAYAAAVKRAPVGPTGKYKSGMGIISGGSSVGTAELRGGKFDNDAIFRITSITDYSAIIESGFYKRYYKTSKKPQGILYWVTQKIRREFGNKISIRFYYLGGVSASSRGGTVPVIEIGRSGLFAGNDTRPGRGGKKRRRRGRK